MKMEDQGQLARIVDLPPDIMHDIFSRLPVKTLGRFKCVSKAWQSLISDPYFVVNYSKQRRRLFFTSNVLKYRVYSLNLDQFLNENPNPNVDGLLATRPTSTELDFGRDLGFYGGYVRSSCYGLFLCVWSRRPVRRMCLINPLTKEFKKLPKPPIWRLPMKPCRKSYALGFDHSTNEHKVIHGQDYKEGIVFSVYTLQTDSWRQIDHLYPYTSEIEGFLVNGAIHWLVSKVADGSFVIISFHLAEEEVREIALPPVAAAANRLWLQPFRNSLCITMKWSPKMMVHNEFWVMKEYGVQESWTKMKISSKKCSYTTHSGFWTESHDLMLAGTSSLVMYNFNDGTFWNVFNIPSFLSVTGVYMESLPLVSMRRVKKMIPLNGVLKYLFSCF